MPIIINDVSKWQGIVDWRKHATARDAVIIRGHNGYEADKYFISNRHGAHSAGISIVGIYQYLVASRDAATQARELIALVGSLAPGEFLICDIEEGSGFGARLRAWLAVVEAHYRVRAWVYSGDANWSSSDLVNATGDRPRWVARYSRNEPIHRYTLWQHRSDASAPGITGRVDESIYPGTLAGLTMLITGGDPMLGGLYRVGGTQTVWAVGPGFAYHVPDPARLKVLTDVGGFPPVQVVTATQMEALLEEFQAMAPKPAPPPTAVVKVDAVALGKAVAAAFADALAKAAA